MKMILSIGNKAGSATSDQKGYTFLELMVTVTILSIGIVSIYRVLLVSLDYQRELSCRLYATNLIEHEIALLEDQYRATGEFSTGENGKLIESVLDRRNVPFQFTVSEAFTATPVRGLIPVEVALSWPDRDRTIRLKRDIYLVNLNIKPTVDAPVYPNL